MMLGLLALLVLLPVLGLVALRLLSPGPDRLGLEDGSLSGCPGSPNCVSTQARDEQHRIEPLRVEGDREEAVRRLKEAIATVPRLRIVTEDQGYLRLEATSGVFRFVDDVEFLVEEGTGSVQARSASRAGYSDLGANRKRIERIRKALAGAR
jgi:uncharacterized protein (DUF1499 family)